MNSLLSYLLFNVIPTVLDILFASVFFFTAFNALFGALVVTTMSIYMGI
jgi:ATP-binding cassette subfamily B (MDR/TAP) protein 6